MELILLWVAGRGVFRSLGPRVVLSQVLLSQGAVRCVVVCWAVGWTKLGRGVPTLDFSRLPEKVRLVVIVRRVVMAVVVVVVVWRLVAHKQVGVIAMTVHLRNK